MTTKGLTYNLAVDKKTESVAKEGVKLAKDGKLATTTTPEGTPDKPQGAPANETEKEEQVRTTVKKNLFVGVYKKTLGSIKSTCASVGINRETFRQWIKNDPDFNFKIRDAWKEKLEDVEELANKRMLEGSDSLIRHFLDRRHPLYKPRVKIEGPTPGELSAEDDADEFFDDEDIENYEPQDEQGLHREEVPDPKQTGGAGAVHSEQSPAVLPGKKDEAKPDSQSAAEGTK
jgi:hypothetical protein